MPGANHDIELTVYERTGGRTYPCRVRDLRDWAAAPGLGGTVDPGAVAGVLKWPCTRCGQACAAALAAVDPVTFDRPVVHWCEPTGLKRLGAIWSGASTDGRPVTPALPPLPVPA